MMVKNARTATVLAVAVAFATIWVVLAPSGTALWVTGLAREFGLVALPTAIMAALFVLCFDWRKRLRRRMLARGTDDRKAQDESKGTPSANCHAINRGVSSLKPVSF
jgi:hypothetical protein